MEFPVELFNKTTVQAFGESFVSSAKLVAQKSDITLGELTAAFGAEHQLLSKWNDTAVDFSFEQGVVGDWIRKAVALSEKHAVIAGANTYTYSELEQRSNRIAHYLHARGLKTGDLAGVLVKRTCDLPALILAIWKLGAAYVPLDPSYPVERVSTILNAAAVKLVVTDSDLVGNLGSFADKALQLDLAEAEIAQSSSSLPVVSIAPDQLAYVIFTSGSTGIPKGVEVTQGALHNFIHAVKREPGIGEHDRLLALTTLAFDISLLELFLPLTSGASVVIVNEEQSQDDLALRHLLDEQQITILQATPATWRLLINSGWRAPAGFRGLCGGELLTSDLAADLLAQGVDLWNLYGPTEATVWTSAYRVRAAADGGVPHIYIGRPLANTQLHVLDDAGRPMPIGAFGELWVSGAGLAKGYLGDVQQTAARFVVDVEGRRLYRTGDQARWTHNGNVEFAGRLDNQIKLRGFRIELEEIEVQLRRHSAIKDAAVVLQHFDKTDQRLVAYIVYHQDEEPTNTELRKHLRQYLPDYMLPQQFTPIAQLPLLPSGKVNRKVLSQPVVVHTSSSEIVLPTTPTEIKLASIWQTALKRDQVSIDGQFFDIGGHSLLALEVILEIDSTFGVRFSPQDMWVNTLEQLAARIDVALGNNQTDIQADIHGEPATIPVDQVSEPVSAAGKKSKGLLSRLFGGNK